MDLIHFSIIIPCFNSASTLHRTLDSIFTQNYNLKKTEVIIIDDCSTDSTLEVIQSFSGFDKLALVSVFKTESNLGPGIARNIGIEASIGRYILFLDSDDTLNDFSLQELYNASLNGADIVLFDGQLISEEPATICKHLKMLNTSNSVKAEAILNLETDEHVIFSAYRRDFLYHLPRFRVGVYEDVAFSGWAYFQAKSIEHLPCVLVNKFQTPGQITENMTPTKAKQYMSARLDLTRKIVEFLPNHSQELKKFFESGLRGSIAVTLKKLKNYSRSQEDFNGFLREFFEFLSGEIDNLEHIVFNHSNTNKDIEAFSFYIDWRKNTL